MINGKSTRPSYFKTPCGRAVSIATMATALRTARANPTTEYRGWEWFPVEGREIVEGFLRGLHDRINRRASP